MLPHLRSTCSHAAYDLQKALLQGDQISYHFLFVYVFALQPTMEDYSNKLGLDLGQRFGADFAQKKLTVTSYRYNFTFIFDQCRTKIHSI